MGFYLENFKSVDHLQAGNYFTVIVKKSTKSNNIAIFMIIFNIFLIMASPPFGGEPVCPAIRIYKLYHFIIRKSTGLSFLYAAPSRKRKGLLRRRQACDGGR